MIAKCTNAWFLKFEEHAPTVDAIHCVHQPIEFIIFYTSMFAERFCCTHNAPNMGAIEEEALTFVFYSTFCKMCTLVRHIVASLINCISSSLIHARAQWLKILFSLFFYLALLPNLIHLVGKITFSQKSNQILFTNGEKK